MNLIVLTGNLGKDPELRYTGSGTPVCTFSIGVSRPHAHDKTDWLQCTAWRQSAEYLGKYAKKGDRVGVEGCMTVRDYEDNNGNKRRAYEVVCDSVELFGKRNAAAQPKQEDVAEAPEGFQEIDDDTPLPF